MLQLLHTKIKTQELETEIVMYYNIRATCCFNYQTKTCYDTKYRDLMIRWKKNDMVLSLKNQKKRGAKDIAANLQIDSK